MATEIRVDAPPVDFKSPYVSGSTVTVLPKPTALVKCQHCFS